ncbi:MAG: Gfo/Idh/MocA family oxidoreductase [Candidatus Latescibacteria bacterium]|nr:Gfo/Idh/MocA family oxidoreductase [Candidatus Latescibacterota bacterium]
MGQIRLGIIGCGIAARELHWPALKTMGDTFRITAVCNHTEPKAQEFAELVGGIPYVLDYRDLIARDDIDAVSIMLPFELNCRVTEDALKTGKHVMVEKPLATDIETSEKMIALCEKYHPLVMMVAENFRYRPLYRRVKVLIDEGRIGNTYGIIWNFFTDVGTGANRKYVSTKWRFEEVYTGGFLIDGGVHITAVLRDLFGEITSVNALTASVNPEAGRFDTMNTQFTMKSGALCSLNQFYSARGVRFNSIHIFGDAGSMLVDNDASKITIMEREKPEYSETTDEERGYVGEYEDFHNAIRTGTPVVSSFHQAYADLKALLAALDSAKTGAVVRID